MLVNRFSLSMGIAAFAWKKSCAEEWGSRLAAARDRFGTRSIGDDIAAAVPPRSAQI
jgi:hypothetical protein